MILESLCSVVLFILTYCIFQLHKKFQYFKERNVKCTKPTFLFGHTKQSLFGQKHTMEEVFDSYWAFPDEEIVGFFQFINPVYIIKNPELIEKVLIKDFVHFYDRLKTDGEIRSPADANLFLMQGNTWRALRNKFTPLFTAGKLKVMFNSITDCGKTLLSVLDEKNGQEVEMSDVMGLFAMDVIGSAAFGLEPHSLQNPNSKFRLYGKKLLDTGLIQNFKVLLFVFLPKVAKLFNIRGMFDVKIVNYFCGIIGNALEYRKKEGFVRNDFVQMLLQLKEKGKIEIQIHEPSDSYLLMDKSYETFEVEMTDDILVGGAFTFLTAGFHATAMSLTFTLFELAQHPEVVEKLRAEIKSCVKGEEPTYDELKVLTYCEKVIKESLRLYPPAPALSRSCTKEYTFPNGLHLKEGETLFIPTSVIQRDPTYWPDPNSFDPDRFDSVPKTGTYLPFGDGPRICIAMRFAMLEMKFALVELMKNYDFKLSEKTKLPLKLNPRIFLYTPLNGIFFYVNKIST